jgi:hypothetical protein
MRLSKPLFGVVLLLLSVGSVWAGEVEVVVKPNPVPSPGYGVVTVKLEKGDSLSFQVFPKPAQRDQKGDTLFIAGTPGVKYTVLITVVNFGEDAKDDTTKGYKKRFDSGEAEISFAGESPNPDVDPSAATLTSKVQKAYNEEPETEKYLAPSLAAVYAKAADYIDNATSWGDLFSKMEKDAKEQKVNGKLLKVQTEIQTYLLRHLPGKDAWDKPMVATDRRKAKDAFATVANAVSKIK